ncbi:Hypothetical_protein [Hexamita inflata]|uniref:Hypothetical_protein n=1 Tax=Hexamita inflata TaxID=28002 RepID=A0AA86UN03_9EUKA|nr:Hypothetical protein HINF_LOCUS26427 [Hexamita inflata]CAI9964750.1 Hypothetical protein HINF_LOCUS52395 [Hexamita inflata]
MAVYSEKKLYDSNRAHFLNLTTNSSFLLPDEATEHQQIIEQQKLITEQNILIASLQLKHAQNVEKLNYKLHLQQQIQQVTNQLNQKRINEKPFNFVLSPRFQGHPTAKQTQTNHFKQNEYEKMIINLNIIKSAQNELITEINQIDEMIRQKQNIFELKLNDCKERKYEVKRRHYKEFKTEKKENIEGKQTVEMAVEQIQKINEQIEKFGKYALENLTKK